MNSKTSKMPSVDTAASQDERYLAVVNFFKEGEATPDEVKSFVNEGVFGLFDPDFRDRINRTLGIKTQ